MYNVFRTTIADNINMPGVAAPKNVILKAFTSCFDVHSQLSFRKKVILGFGFLTKEIMIRFEQISFKLHEHVDCSLFETMAYL